MIYELRITRIDGSQEFTEIMAHCGMCVATHIITDIRSLGYHVSDPTISEVRYCVKGSDEYRYA